MSRSDDSLSWEDEEARRQEDQDRRDRSIEKAGVYDRIPLPDRALLRDRLEKREGVGTSG